VWNYISSRELLSILKVAVNFVRLYIDARGNGVCTEHSTTKDNSVLVIDCLACKEVPDSPTVLNLETENSQNNNSPDLKLHNDYDTVGR
jgi:hypothetical protein